MSVHCTLSVAGSPGVWHGVPVDLACHNGREHRGRAVISDQRQSNKSTNKEQSQSRRYIGRGDHSWVPTKLCRARSRCQANSSGGSVEGRKANVSRYTGHATLKSSLSTSDVSLSFCFAATAIASLRDLLPVLAAPAQSNKTIH